MYAIMKLKMKNKKVLLLSPRFFKYEEKIQKAIIDICADKFLKIKPPEGGCQFLCVSYLE